MEKLPEASSPGFALLTVGHRTRARVYKVSRGRLSSQLRLTLDKGTESIHPGALRASYFRTGDTLVLGAYKPA